MFKPHKAICHECKKERWIVVKRGLCHFCNNNKKSSRTTCKNRQQKTKKKAIQYRRKPTGEKAFFKKTLEEKLKNSTTINCACCGNWIGPTITHINFSHVLPKSTFPSYRLDERNIFIVCAACHHEWEFGNRNQPKFALKRQRAEELKQEYYKT